MKKIRIIIAGGGPVGVVAALACAQQGYAITLLEAEAKLDDSPRAATTHPSTLEMIARVGLIEPFIQEGLVQTEQHKLARMGMERLKTFADADVRFATRATGVSQDADSATVTAEGPNGSETFRGDYVIGADGGRSTIRKALDIEFEGFTWPERFLG
jgi:3-(3-hydroxy-phenyl)propionate hydroxylase